MEDMTATVRGLTIGKDTDYPFAPEFPQGVLGTADIRTADQSLARRSGEVPGGDFEGGQDVNYTVRLIGTLASVEQRIADLRVAFAPAQADEQLDVRFSGTPTEYARFGRCRGILEPAWRTRALATVVADVRCKFRASDGTRYGAEMVQVIGLAAHPLPQTLPFILGYHDEETINNPGVSTTDRWSVEMLAKEWTPLELPGLVTWLDFSDESTVTEAGGTLSAITDKSGNGNDYEQSTGASQPAYGTRTLNGHLVADFDGSDDMLVPSTGYSVSQPLTILFIAEADVVDAASRRLLSGGALLRHGATDVRELFATFFLLGGSADTDPHAWTAILDGASSSLRVDAAEEASGDAGAAGVDSGHIIGALHPAGGNPAGGDHWDGAIAHAVIVDGALSGDDLANLEAWAMGVAGLATPPGTGLIDPSIAHVGQGLLIFHDLTLTDGETLLVNGRERRALLNGVTPVIPTIAQWWQIEPGSNTIRFAASASSSLASTATLTYRPGFG